jgi:glycine/D-amino acid oxidase-like deaminating enzyme
MTQAFHRRDFLLRAGAGLSAAALAGCSLGEEPAATAPPPLQRVPPLPLVRAARGRITAITVCTRPFRAAGPRLDVERIADKVLVHNYGHGGSGWSLSWGSSTIAMRKALATGAKDIAVIGCGALGLTSAILLQRAGLRVTIYAKDRPPEVRSSLATGVWSPDSRLCLEENADAGFKASWEEMCRISYRTYQNYLGLAGDPVEWFDNYILADGPFRFTPPSPPNGNEPRFAALQRTLVPDLVPAAEQFPEGTHPFPSGALRRSPSMMFNIPAYARLLLGDFLANGGHIETREFHSPRDFAALRQRTLINATGYGARALFGDNSLIPVRGQLVHMIPQPEIRYGLLWQTYSMVPRRDGLVVQALGEEESIGYGDDSTAPDREAAEQAVAALARVTAEMHRPGV